MKQKLKPKTRTLVPESSAAMRVLLIEDQESDAELIKRYATMAGSVVLTWVKTLSEGFKRLKNVEAFDIILVDLGLPDSEGLPTLETLLEKSLGVPVVVLTGDLNEHRGVKAVRMGADDYLLKGEIRSESLVRSLRYAVERARKPRDTAAKSEEAFMLRSPGIDIDLRKQLIYRVRAGRRDKIELTPNEFKLFLLLFENVNSVISRNRIVAEIWGEDDGTITIRTVDRHLSSLKKKLEGFDIPIETIYGIGYRFPSI